MAENKDGIMYEGTFLSPLATLLPGLLPVEAEMARYDTDQETERERNREREGEEERVRMHVLQFQLTKMIFIFPCMILCFCQPVTMFGFEILSNNSCILISWPTVGPTVDDGWFSIACM